MAGIKFRCAYVAICLVMMLVHQSAGRVVTESLYARTASIDPPCHYKSVLGRTQIGAIDTYPATPQLVASQRMLIHSDTIIAKGTLDSALIAVDLVPKNNEIANVAKTLSKSFVKRLGYIAPALGIFSAVVGAAIDVNSPTADDILKEVNKAVTLLAEEVESRFAEMKDYVDASVLRLERNLNSNKFTFLMCYWAECLKTWTWQDSKICQQHAYRLIQASQHDFLPFLPQFNKNATRFDLSTLKRIDLQRMEASQLNFMNYAFMSMYVSRTLQTTYGYLVQEKKKKSQSSDSADDLSPVLDKECKEFLKEKEKKFQERLVADPSAELSEEDVWKGYYCTYHQDFEDNAKLFKLYGEATIKTIGEPNSLVPKSPFDINRISFVGEGRSEKKSFEYYISSANEYSDQTCTIDTVSCSVPFTGSNPISESPCKVKVDLLIYPPADYQWLITTGKNGNLNRRRKILRNCVYPNMTPRKIKHNKLIYVAGLYFSGEKHDGVKEWCKMRLQDQNTKYNARRAEVQGYWMAHIGVLTECNDRLASSSTQDIKVCDRKQILDDLQKKKRHSFFCTLPYSNCD